MSHRIEQAESTLRRVISQVLARRVSDPRIVGMVSVTRVEISPDRRNAGVFVSILPEQYEKRTMSGLVNAAIHIQNLVREEVAMRIVPHLSFHLDRSLKKQAEIFGAIDRALGADGSAEEEDLDRSEPEDPAAPPRT